MEEPSSVKRKLLQDPLRTNDPVHTGRNKVIGEELPLSVWKLRPKVLIRFTRMRAKGLA
jgi:hypothetical protein